MTGMAKQVPALAGGRLLVAAMVLALSNFMVVLDTTIANVSVPHIAGGLGISSDEGTWVITSYSVAEAVCVPLTGFLTARFGAVRTFVAGMIGFGLFSMLCGLSNSLTMLILFRLGQGFCGGPLMPLTQTLLLRIFPRERHAAAMGMWAMTTVTAPILGPILGGTISDNWAWSWIFFINLPVAVFCVIGAVALLRPAETPLVTARIDRTGMALMVLWIAALQIMLDLGRNRDWFGDPLIVVLGLVAAVGFALFCAWEYTEAQPAVDLRVFRHRGFTASVLALAFAFGTFFTSAVIIPQWLQSSLGYTATWAGYATAFTGVSAVIASPIVARLSTKYDPRALVCFGILWLGFTTLLRVHWTSGVDFWSLAIPQLLQGIGMPFFFIPVTTIGLAAVNVEETASAAGLMSFLRTMSAAIATSIATTAWNDDARVARSEIVARLNPDATVNALHAAGFPMGQIRGTIEQFVDGESLALATGHIFLVSAFVFAFAAAIIWLAPRPARQIAPGASH
ncbi:MAG TPA: DHA2 family efflux MFS transporter permease subunit [Sphingomonas sp.]